MEANATQPADGDMNASLMLDGNAVAGLLDEVFGREMTLAQAECEGCGSRRMMGGLHAFTHAPGVVLRCPDCGSIIMRMVVTETHYWIDARGAMYLRVTRG